MGRRYLIIIEKAGANYSAFARHPRVCGNRAHDS